MAVEELKVALKGRGQGIHERNLMTSESDVSDIKKRLEEKIQALQQQINALANQLVDRSPDGRELVGRREACREVLELLATVADAKTPCQGV